MEKKIFYKWTFLMSLILFFTGISFVTGWYMNLYQLDITKLSFVIFAVFFFYSYKIGVSFFKSVKNKASTDYLKSLRSIASDRCHRLPELGMLGTVIGLIYVFYSTVHGITPEATAQMLSSLGTLSIGIGTALLTTATGLVCSILLNIQIFWLEQIINNK